MLTMFVLITKTHAHIIGVLCILILYSEYTNAPHLQYDISVVCTVECSFIALIGYIKVRKHSRYTTEDYWLTYYYMDV